jgi:hypothetical protein
VDKEDVAPLSRVPKCLCDTKLFFKFISFNIRVKKLFFLGGPILAVFPYIKIGKYIDKNSTYKRTEMA